MTFSLSLTFHTSLDADEKETHIDEILGPAIKPHNSDNEDDSTPEEESKELIIVSNATIEIKPTEVLQSEPQLEVAIPEIPEIQLQRNSTHLEIKEVVLSTEEKSQFLISVVDKTLLAEDSDQESSEEEKLEDISSTKSSPPPDQECITPPPPDPECITPPPPDQEYITPPVITVNSETLPVIEPTVASNKENDSSGNSTPELERIACAIDRRRPSGVCGGYIDS